MLFEAARHGALCERTWDEDRARRVIRSIAEDLQASLRPDDFWPEHPLDGDVEKRRTGQKCLYFGAAGATWALWYLDRADLIDLLLDPPALIDRVLDAYLEDPDTGSVVPSYFLGEAGIRLVHWRLTGSAASADALASSVERNRTNPTQEALWGAPGTMVASLQMLAWTGEERWRHLFRADADRLLSQWLPSPYVTCDLWTQDLYGKVLQLLGAGHGFAGNVYPLLRGAEFLDDAQCERLFDGCVATLEVTAIDEAGAANWPPGVDPGWPSERAPLMQWCHGAPGIVTGLAHFPGGRSASMDEMLRRAGEAIWLAGPLVKGHGICHGTAGNGYAFLTLHRRTSDPTWLVRARRFAMHAIDQWDSMRREYGRGRHSLWTGDPGLAVYLWHCIAGRDGLPGIDVLD